MAEIDAHRPRRPATKPGHRRAVLPAVAHISGDAASARAAVASIQGGTGPIVLIVKGTNNAPVDNANRATLEAMQREFHDPLSVISIDYPAAFPPWPHSVTTGAAAFRRLLDELRGRTGGRPVILLAESQGAWVSRDVLSDPRYSQLIGRMVTFAEPAISGLVPGVERALVGSIDAFHGPDKLRIRHVDDAVTATPPALDLVFRPEFLQMLWTLVTEDKFSYDPHDYTPDAAVAARFLLTGARPSAAGATHQHRVHIPA